MKQKVKSLIKNSLQKVGIEVSYVGGPDRDPQMYINTLRGGVSVKNPFNIVQVGANDGKYNDPIFDFVKTHKDITKIILIEPQEELIPYLKENYTHHPEFEIYNKAIGKEETTLCMYRINKQYWNDIDVGYEENWPDYRVPTGITTSDREQLSEWVSTKTDLSPDEAIERYDVNVVQPNSILNESGIIDEVDLLQVDTEGMDDEVVYSFFENDIYPRIINSEIKHLDDNQQNRYDKKMANNGYEVYDYAYGEKLALKREQT
ncbi:FkbM family methyltransferase [Halobacterium salinarum]|uniref:FkbM family methyltransferase n=1 Tax=Halobacterium salinarum TaxID=2242 RepID=UPI002557AE8E|nr:FkbM family methyltransferase [Halobacterium salinarum]MDL0121725.1 FkbM family methyltransferase [Halobacterium salinarum]